MTAAVLVPLLLLVGLVLVFAAAVLVWRLAWRSLYPNCTCWLCGRRR